MRHITGLVYDDQYLKHRPGEWHPERPARLEAIMQRLQDTGLLEELVLIRPYPAPVPWIERLHDPDYIKRFKAACEKGYTIFGVPDCGICPESYEVALLAVGGVFAAIENVMNGLVQNAFCAVRPPGHHAERNKAMGFCFFNNIALGAVYLLENFGLERVAIVDWDVHHGNGTQHLFESDPRVFYLSLHEDPYSCYPGTGLAQEQGKGKGLGFTLNLPLPAGSGDEAYLGALEREGLPRLREFAPQFVLISAGFDAHEDDPLAHQNLTRGAYQKMGSLVLKLAEDFAQGRLISVLEGGYNLTVLADCVEDHLRLLLGNG
jgi:acetoin utilization deacetylase AcuC-like enzyme|uniref:Histone deacetylase n=1 Tax=Desulfobacca acetoxidans TaxID=60893 RepID=A0A7C3UW29_9BACT